MYVNSITKFLFLLILYHTYDVFRGLLLLLFSIVVIDLLFLPFPLLTSSLLFSLTSLPPLLRPAIPWPPVCKLRSVWCRRCRFSISISSMAWIVNKRATWRKSESFIFYISSFIPDWNSISHSSRITGDSSDIFLVISVFNSLLSVGFFTLKSCHERNDPNWKSKKKEEEIYGASIGNTDSVFSKMRVFPPQIRF